MVNAQVTEQDADVFFLFDRSGSMADRLSDAQGGYDTFISEQQKAESERHICLWDFDTEHRLVYGLTEAKKIPADSYTLVPRGATALLDAITRIVAYAESHRDAARQTFVVIQTDGYENSSTEATQASVKSLIEKKIADGWLFIYLGANQDAIAVASSYGIPVATAATYDVSHAVTTSGGAVNMMNVGLRGGGYAFTDTQRKSFVDTGTASPPPTVTAFPHTVFPKKTFPNTTGTTTTTEDYDPEPLKKFD